MIDFCLCHNYNLSHRVKFTNITPHPILYENKEKNKSMGCLKNILKACVIVLAVVGFTAIGGKDYFIGLWNGWFNPPQDVMLQRAKKVADFSKVGDEYEIDKATSAFGYSGVLSEHKATGQKIVILDSGIKPLLTPEDFKGKKIDKKLNDLSKHLKYKVVNVEDLKITKRGYINAFGKKAPYVMFDAKATHLPAGNITGMVSAVKTTSGKDKMLVSVNEKGKYSQIITKDFFNKLK